MHNYLSSHQLFSYDDIAIKIEVFLRYKHVSIFNNNPEIIKNVILLICTQGQAEIEIDGISNTITSNMMFFLFPNQKVSIIATSNDFNCIGTSHSFSFLDTLIVDIPFLFLLYCKNNPIFTIDKNLVETLKGYFLLLKGKTTNANNIYISQIMMHMLQIIYLDICNFLHPYFNMQCNKNQIVNDFFLLIKKHIKESKEVGFYANKLCIAPKHLNRLVKKTIGNKTAKEWIDYILIVEIKKTLRNNSIRLKEIAEMFGFSSQFLFFQFFKKHVGISPNEYRRLNSNFS